MSFPLDLPRVCEGELTVFSWLFTGAIEKQKLVYILNRDAAARLTISSPHEAHKSHTLVFDMCGVDVGFENPLFACLEVDYEEADQDETGAALAETPMTLTFYELDLGTVGVGCERAERALAHRRPVDPCAVSRP